MVWYDSWAAGMPRRFWSIRLCAWLHWLAKTACRICASAPAPRVLLWSYGPPAQIVSSLSWSRSTSTLPNTIAPRRPLPSGSARSQSAPAPCSYQSARPFAVPTSGGAAADAGDADHVTGSEAAPATTAAALSTCLRVTAVDRVGFASGSSICTGGPFAVAVRRSEWCERSQRAVATVAERPQDAEELKRITFVLRRTSVGGDALRCDLAHRRDRPPPTRRRDGRAARHHDVAAVDVAEH